MRFICKCCIFHMHVTFAVGNGRSLSKLPRRRVHGAAQARCRKTLQVSNESSAVMFIKLKNKYVTTYSYVIQPIFGAKQIL